VAGAPDPPSLDDGSPLPRARHMPTDKLATRSTAKDQAFEPFWLRHAFLPKLSAKQAQSARNGLSPLAPICALLRQ
jgi:hypothetical protein